MHQRIQTLRDNQKLKTVLGINLGKNKTSTNTVGDYVLGVERLVNFSMPAIVMNLDLIFRKGEQKKL